MKLSDYVTQKVVELGISDVFMITGGGAMHLNQSLGNHKDLSCLFNHHEQACAMAADSYYRLTNRPALVNVTTGPGGTNTLTGIHGAWTDSLGVMVISGQVKYPTTIQSTGLDLRQMGDQEIDIVRLVSSITKYSVMINDPQTIRYHLEKSYYLTTTGRPGPTWIDIPINIQGANIDPNSLPGFTPENEAPTLSDTVFADVLNKLQQAKRPALFAGAGVRLSRQQATFLELAETLGIPVVTGWNAHDTIWDNHPNYAGRPGTVGNRAGNFTVQNSDCLMVLGSRLNIRQISYNWENFAKQAYTIWVDIDPVEMQKPTVSPDLRIQADLKDFLPGLLATAKKNGLSPSEHHQHWLTWCKDRVRRYPVVLKEYWESEAINPYCFIDRLFTHLQEDQITVCANGSACVIGFQAASLKKGQRLWSNSGSASMGYDLPAAIGAAIGAENRPVVCLAGDGSIMMNLQELQTIASNSLNIKIFIINNGGYSSIFQTHRNFFDGVEVGASPKSGVSFPDFEKIAYAFDLPYTSCTSHENLDEVIAKTLSQPGPALCNVIVAHDHTFAPKLSAKQLPDGTIVSPSLEDMSPFLSKEELKENLLDD